MTRQRKSIMDMARDAMATGPAPKEEEMEPIDRMYTEIRATANEARTAERRALAREAYMAALGELGAAAYVKDPVGEAVALALETVRRWDSFLAAVDAEDLLRKSENNNDLG